jgi:alanine dehydrogenase
LLPAQCVDLQKKYPTLQFFVQSSPVRCVNDDEYAQVGLPLVDNLENCDVIFGIKEVPLDWLIPNKTYFFFSHTIKKQIYNLPLLKAILNKKIRMIDYECLTTPKNERLVAFGRFAGIVGAYNALRIYGKKYNLFNIKPAFLCKDLKEIHEILKGLPPLPAFKTVVTGSGRVAKGAMEILDLVLQKVSKEDYLTKKFDCAVYTNLHSLDYYTPINGVESDFYKNPQDFVANFLPFAKVSDMLVTAHFWDINAQTLFTKTDMKSNDFNIKIIADITCDINGSVPCTLRATNIQYPVYDYDVLNECEVEEVYKNPNHVTVMAVDNLPAELPYNASEMFGEQIAKYIFPALFGISEDADILTRATVAEMGELTEKFNYLADFEAWELEIKN